MSRPSGGSRAHNGLLFPDGPVRRDRRPLAAVVLLALGGLFWFATRSSPAAPPPLVTLTPARPAPPIVARRDSSSPRPPRNWEELVASRVAAAERQPAAAPAPAERDEQPAPRRERERPRRESPRERPAAPAPPSEPTQQTAASADPGRLSVSSTPWGQLIIDGRMYGNTPRLGLPIAVGQRRVRIARDGFAPFDTTITVDPGEVIRITGITLREQP